MREWWHNVEKEKEMMRKVINLLPQCIKEIRESSALTKLHLPCQV